MKTKKNSLIQRFCGCTLAGFLLLSSFALPAYAATLKDYDESDTKILFSAGWGAFSVSDAYNGTVHSTSAADARMRRCSKNAPLLKSMAEQARTAGILTCFLTVKRSETSIHILKMSQQIYACIKRKAWKEERTQWKLSQPERRIRALTIHGWKWTELPPTES